MARPRKIGLDYFPHDTDAVNDEKLEMLMSEHGTAGYTFYFVVLERIYRSGIPEFDISSVEKRSLLTRKMHLTLPKFDRILKTALSLSLFNLEVYNRSKILTSAASVRNCSKIQ